MRRFDVSKINENGEGLLQLCSSLDLSVESAV